MVANRPVVHDPRISNQPWSDHNDSCKSRTPSIGTPACLTADLVAASLRPIAPSLAPVAATRWRFDPASVEAAAARSAGFSRRQPLWRRPRHRHPADAEYGAALHSWRNTTLQAVTRGPRTWSSSTQKGQQLRGGHVNLSCPKPKLLHFTNNANFAATFKRARTHSPAHTLAHHGCCRRCVRQHGTGPH